MISWISISELIGLPGIPGTSQNLRLLAKRENWRSRKRSGQGGGYEYAFESLPPATQSALRERSPNENEVTNSITVPEKVSIFVSSRIDDQRIWAFSLVQRSFEEFWAECKYCTKLEAELQFCNLYNRRELTLPSHCYEILPTISRASLCRKRKVLQQQGVMEMGRCGMRVAFIDSNSQLAEAIEVCLISGGTDWRPGQVKLLLEQQYPDLPTPSESQIRRWVQNFAQKNPAKYKAYQGQKIYRNESMPAFGLTDMEVDRPNQLWELDSSPTDIMLSHTDPLTGEIKEKRYALVACIDIYSRRSKIVVVPTSKASAILLCLRKAIADWGVPEKIKIDNGQDYKSFAVQRFCSDLSTEVQYCTPYTPQEKPHVERFFRTFQHSELELLPGFVGHSVAQRDRKRNQEGEITLKMSPEDFQAWCDDWCKKDLTRSHKGLQGKAPIQKMQQAIAFGWEKRTVSDSRKLDLLCMAVDSRKVQKQGIQLENRYYVADILGSWVGKTVWVRFDPQQPDEIFIYQDELATDFLCSAKWQNAHTPEELAEVAAIAKARAKEQTHQADLYKKAKKLNQQKAETPAKLIGKDGEIKLVEPKTELTTPALDGAALALQKEPPAYKPYSPEDQAILDLGAAKPKPEPIVGSIFEGAKRYEELIMKLQGGEVLNEIENRFVDWYEKDSPEIRRKTIARLNPQPNILKFG